jgi:hypothetical protein
MRTTVTLDPDVAAHVRRVMTERGITFKQAVNDAIRTGLAPKQSRRYETPVHDMGEPAVDLTKALRLAGELEDEERIRRLTSGS